MKHAKLHCCYCSKMTEDKGLSNDIDGLLSLAKKLNWNWKHYVRRNRHIFWCKECEDAGLRKGD